MTDNPEYLGDGLYVRYDGFMVWLFSSNGIETLDEVALEPKTLTAFLKYLRSIYGKPELIRILDLD